MKNKEKKIIIILISALVIFDQILKIFFMISKLKIGDIIGITEQLKSENNIQNILIYIIAIMFLIRYITRNNTYIKIDSKIVISFAIAGCISNLIDRIWYKSVINYINIPKFIGLNMGYIYIIITWIGMAVILTKYTSERIKEKNEKANNSQGK